MQRIVIPVPFALHSANAWLFPGKEPALVDCGIGTEEGYAALVEGIKKAGVDPRKLRLFITHGHVDHAGNAARLHRESGVPLAAPRTEAPYIETFRRDATKRNDAFSRALATHGAPPEIVDSIRAGGRTIDAWLEDTPIQHDLRDGQRIAVGDMEATAHITPGHTPGSTVFLVDDRLLSGDTLLEHITSNAIELLDRDRGRYAQYVATLEGMRRFVGCQVLPGHHDEFRLTDALLDGHLAKHARRSAKMVERLDRPKTAWQLLAEVLPHLANGQEFLGMCEMVGHLHALEDAGSVRMLEAEGVRRFVRR